jgi:hypothetical protein
MWWEHWFDNELSAKIENLVRTKQVESIKGQLHVKTEENIQPGYLHVTGSTDCRICHFWYDIFFQQLGLIHSFCRYHCWKVVTRPRNVRELIQLYNLMYVVPFVYNFINPISGKAGLDFRTHTPQPYGAFSYAITLVEALRIKEITLHMITEYMPNEKIDGKHLQDTVQVKRACTEFEGIYPGESEWWDTLQTREEWEVERRLEEIFVAKADMSFQPAWLKDKVLQKWLVYANSIGDKSAVDFVGADVFNVHTKAYVGKDLQPKGGEKEPPKKRVSKRAKSKEKKNASSNKKD